MVVKPSTQLPVCGEEGLWLGAANGVPKKPGFGCQSGFGLAAPHKFVPIGPGGPGTGPRGGKPGGAPGGPHGDEIEPRGLVDEGGPHPWPTAPAGAARRVAGVLTTSSSSASSAAEPETFGLRDRRVGDVEPEPDVSPAGRAMGAMGAMVGRPIGPRSGAGVRLLGPGARLSWVGEARGFETTRIGGAIGAGGANPRPKPASKWLPFPKPRGTADGASGGGPGAMDGPGAIGTPTNGGVNGSLGDKAGGITPLTDGGKTGVGGSI